MTSRAPSFLIESSSFLQVMSTCMNVRMSSNFCQIPTLSVFGVICPGMSEKLTYILAATLPPLFLIGSSSFLQVIRTTINAGMSSNFNQIGRLWCIRLPSSVGKNPYRLI